MNNVSIVSNVNTQYNLSLQFVLLLRNIQNCHISGVSQLIKVVSYQFNAAMATILFLIILFPNLACNGIIGMQQFVSVEWIQLFSVTYLTSATVMTTQWDNVTPDEFCRDLYPMRESNCTGPEGNSKLYLSYFFAHV